MKAKMVRTKGGFSVDLNAPRSHVLTSRIIGKTHPAGNRKTRRAKKGGAR